MEPDETPVASSQHEESSTGLDANVAGMLTYLLGFLSGIVFLILEKKSSYVRFHAMQSTIAFIGLFVIQMVAGVVPLIGWLIVLLSVPVTVIVWIVMMVKAFQGERYQLPLVGEIAEERAKLPPGGGQ